jgi:VIT1/CCC1 family predicted Fe2+/Mn2+ transporter
MLSQGPIPRFAHGVIEYVVGALLIAAPFLLGFSDESSATAVSIVVGVLVLLIAATSHGPTALSGVVPLQIHLLLDFTLGAFLIAAPFVFGFSDNDTALPFFIVLGVLHLLVTVATRFERRDRQG